MGSDGKRVTIGDVARRAKVSNAAVSMALNGRPGVSERTRRRITKVADELGWRPNIHARAMLNQRSYAVGMVVGREPEQLATDSWFPVHIAAIESVLEAAGYVLVLRFLGRDPDVELDAYKRLAGEGRVDGFVIVDVREGDPRLALLAELGVPTDWGVTEQVYGSHEAAIADAVEHLAGLGHERIAFVEGEPDFLHSRQRLGAWQRAMAPRGLDATRHRAGGFTWTGGATATRELLTRRSRPTAIMFASDTMAIAGAAAARALGLDVPGDVSIVGFDDVPTAAFHHPALTTVHQDIAGAARFAAEVLVASIEGRPAQLPDVEPARLVVRDSTATPHRQSRGDRRT